MIERLVGICALKRPGGLILDVSGVGYGVDMTAAALAAFPLEGEPVTVWIYTHVKEDALKLFGFLTYAERQLFEILLSVNDVGPRMAMAIMSTLTLRQLLDAVEAEDPAVLEAVQGIGAKKSKPILFTLKNKLKKLGELDLLTDRTRPAGATAGPMPLFASESAASRSAAASLPKSLLADLRSALLNFGYKDREVGALLRLYERQPPARDLEGLIRAALADIAGALRAPATPALGDEELF